MATRVYGTGWVGTGIATLPHRNALHSWATAVEGSDKDPGESVEAATF